MFRKEFLARCTLAAGRTVSPDLLEYCQRRGYVDRPPKRGGRGWYDVRHLQQVLKHLEQRGRFVGPEVDNLIAQAAEVGKRPRSTAGLEGDSNA